MTALDALERIFGMTKEKILYYWKPTEEEKNLGSKHSWDNVCFFDEYKVIEDSNSPFGLSVHGKHEDTWMLARCPLFPLIKNMLFGMDDFFIESNCGKEIADNRAIFEQQDILKKKEESKNLE